GRAAPLLVSHRARVSAARGAAAPRARGGARRQDRPLHAAARRVRRPVPDAVVVLEGHAPEDSDRGRGAPQPADRRARRAVLRARRQRGARAEGVRSRAGRRGPDRRLQLARPRGRGAGVLARDHPERRAHGRPRFGRAAARDARAAVARRGLRQPRARRGRRPPIACAARRDEGMRLLFRTFVAQFAAGETVTSDLQMRRAAAGLVATVITPGLLLLLEVFPDYQSAVVRVHAHRAPPGLIDDRLEWVVLMLCAYSMATVGLVATFAWDALAFDRRDASVLGPLPIAGRTIITAKLAALAALLLGTAAAVNGLNAFVFAFETSDLLGARALVAHGVGILVRSEEH